MGKYNVGIGIYNSKLSVYTIVNGKFFKINNKTIEKIDILENLKVILNTCKEYYETEEIEIVLSIQENLSDEVKYKIRNLVKIAGFTVKEEINENTAVSLAYGIEEIDEFVFIISVNQEKSTLKVISSEYNIDSTLDLEINLRNKKSTDDVKIIKYIQDKIKSILKEMNYHRGYKVILLGDILKDDLFNKKISTKISNIYNYREDALAMGCAVKSYDDSYDIKIFEKNIEVRKNSFKDKRKENKSNVNIGHFYYINKQYDKAKEVLNESITSNLIKGDEYIKSLIYLLHIHIIEDNFEQVLSINSKIKKINIESNELKKLYKEIISRYEPVLIDRYKKRILKFKYEIINIIDNGFEFNIEINQKIREYEINLNNNSSILNLDREFIIDELRNEIKILNEKIEKDNITVFYDLRNKINEIIEYLE